MGRLGHVPPKNFAISYLLENYFLHFQKQLKTYFTKKSSYRYANYLSLSKRKMTILNTEKIFSIRATKYCLSREQSVFGLQIKGEVCVFSYSLFVDL